MQSKSIASPPFHVAIIMDGNGRWGTRHGLSRTEGHHAGAEAVKRTVEAAAALGVTTLSLFAFSAANWRRPKAEVDGLMTLLNAFLADEATRLADAGVRFAMLGRRDRLPTRLARGVEQAEQATAKGGRLTLRIAIDYSSREAIAGAAARMRPGGSLKDLDRLIDAAGPVDLLIRTGGEKRLSDFMLWECAYAELWFTDRMWPEFEAADLAAAIADFHRRERTFGALPATDSTAAELRVAG